VQAFAAGRRTHGLGVALERLPHYDPARARSVVRAALAADPSGASFIRPLQYRPFDLRWFIALAPLCHRPRPDLLAAMDHSRIALVSVRKDRGALPWTHATVARAAIDNCLLSTRSSCRARAFPSHAPDGSENLGPSAAAELARRIGRRAGSEQLIDYALAVLSCPAFRQRYDPALRLDYPRIPWPADAAQFDALSAAGRALAELLLQASTPEPGALLAATAPLDRLLHAAIG
jgi:predicted helicase